MSLSEVTQVCFPPSPDRQDIHAAQERVKGHLTQVSPPTLQRARLVETRFADTFESDPGPVNGSPFPSSGRSLPISTLAFGIVISPSNVLPSRFFKGGLLPRGLINREDWIGGNFWGPRHF